MGLRVYGGPDYMTDEWVIAFRYEREREASRGVVVDGRVVYEPPHEGNARPTITLRREEAEALGAHLAKHGFMPKPPDDLGPTQKHLSDAITVRDRLLSLVERK